ncbi:NAD(P)-dependent dehydrogenase (short-subunit alcohol dehydrogenase family) [Breoghania corrubedonensis]|uniref:NAD(P)-dependent dehydrogenase (Short-subunit alcohol dehydrogenase family) n=1 Tax=Breoghania corrubedonensis TaxID=665038 RepID=A0A2T5V6P2_9HYPH|nr:SDR family NAD(P)-dependent oxidoreductase [Breoghania corrubedonensis]PTW59410.1 NAD(P)-dependent dehydrogenase (short-subunit alcohol dehydrogenase family) [Breoghania corrubedonensis]
MEGETKVVLLSGAAGGIGRAAALKFASTGAALALTDIPQDGLRETARLAGEAGAQVWAHTCDISLEDDVTGLIEGAVTRFGRLDIAVNNAGIAHEPARIADLDLATFQRMLAVNLTGTFLCLRAQTAIMREQGHGSILNVASLAGLVGAPLLGAYAAAKHGVVGLTKTAAAECARSRVRVNALCPSFADTAMVGAIASGMRGSADEAVSRLLAGIPMGRLASPQEIAEAIVWITGDANSFMTGQAVALDGGASAV